MQTILSTVFNRIFEYFILCNHYLELSGFVSLEFLVGCYSAVIHIDAFQSITFITVEFI